MESGNKFFSCDLDGSNIKILSESDELSNARIYLVNDEKAFYYTPWDNSFKTINLSTGEITTIVDKCLSVVHETLKNDTILVLYQYIASDNPHSYFAKLNLETFELTEEKIIDNPYPSYYCMNNHKVYSIENFNRKSFDIYEDNTLIYSYPKNTNNMNDSYTVFVQDNYIFAIIGSKILKIDMNNYNLIYEKDIGNKYSLVPSNTPGASMILGTHYHALQITATEKPLFYSNNAIYKFDSERLEFEKVISDDRVNGYGVEYGEYIIIQGHDTTTVFNKESNQYKVFDSCNYSIENDYIYLMTYKGDLYHQKSSYLEFEVEKLKIKDIV